MILFRTLKLRDLKAHRFKKRNLSHLFDLAVKYGCSSNLEVMKIE
jgi:hypothetical protein